MNNVTKQFVLAGKAIFTLEIEPAYASQNNLKPHYTFKVSHKPPQGNYKETWFVSYLTGPDNTSNYTYVGILSGEYGTVRLTDKSKLKSDSLIYRLLGRTLALIWKDDIQPLVDKGFNLHHEGRCCRCGRVLSTPESCDRGIGPECWKHLNGGNYPNISTNGTFSE